jgi:rhomboid protease GluP
MDLTIMDSYDLLVMKLIHYFIVSENYTPIIIKGIDDEVWLENKNNEYSIIRIVTRKIINKEQYDYDILKTKHIAKQLKRKLLDFSMNVLSIYLDKNFYTNKIDNFDEKYISILIKDEDDFINNEYINKAYKNLRDKFVYKEEGFELISKLTKEIEEKNIKEGQEREKYMKNNKPIITYILIFINIVMFVLMYMLGNGSENTNTLIDFGANYILLTKAGEYYRLITSGFLHIGVIHLLLNMYSLYIVGSQVEYFYGKVKYIIIYLFSLIMGSLFTVALSSVNTVSAGASGAIFGLLGSILYFGIKYRGYIGNSLVNQIVPVVVLNLIIGFTTPGIGNAAHIGGLIGGYLISMAVGIGIDKKEQRSSRINGIIISAILTIFMIYIGFVR